MPFTSRLLFSEEMLKKHRLREINKQEKEGEKSILPYDLPIHTFCIILNIYRKSPDPDGTTASVKY